MAPELKRGKGVSVTYDDDGGCTVKDIRSGLVVSIIGTHPAAANPAGVYIEVYSYDTGKDINWNAGKAVTIEHHATFLCYPVPRETDGDREARLVAEGDAIAETFYEEHG